MPTYKTLVVAPKTDLLLVDDEVSNVINKLGAKICSGSDANLHGLLRFLSEPYDIIWFATHGDEKGVYLTDGILSISEITTMIRSAGAQLTVFNTCASRPVALTIHDELKTDFVCTVKRVPDRTAFITGAVFAKKIADGLSFEDAFNQARPGQDTTYTFIPGESREMPMPPGMDRSRHGQVTVEQLQEIVDQLNQLVNGDPNLRLVGLVDSNERVIKEVRQMGDRLAAIDAKQSRTDAELKTLRFLLIGLIAAVGLIALIWVIVLFGSRGGV